MNDLPRQKLCELILEYGRSLCDDPRRCEALLKDHCGQHKREIFVLISALKSRVSEDLLKARSSGLPETLVWSRARRRLEDELAMTKEAAQWAIESWVSALSILAQPSSEAPKDTPASSQLPIEPKTELGQSPLSSETVDKLLEARYRDHGDGTITDMITSLQWMRCSVGQEWRGNNCGSEAKRIDWYEALQIAEAINRNGGYAGFCDWRLPTHHELLTLVYCSSDAPKKWNTTGEPCQGNSDRPTINQLAFPNTPPSYFWSTQRSEGQNTCAAVHFGNGQAENSTIYYSYPYVRARLVRGSLLFGSRYQDQGDGTVTDIKTGLQWLRFCLGQEWNDGDTHGKARKYMWRNARDAARNFNNNGGFAGYADWRLPSKNELLTLVYCDTKDAAFWNGDGEGCPEKCNKLTIYNQAFPNTAAYCWTSSVHESFSGFAWAVFFDTGKASLSPFAADGAVRLARHIRSSSKNGR